MEKNSNRKHKFIENTYKKNITMIMMHSNL